MNEHGQRFRPFCSKCERPMVWHSTQTVSARQSSEETMEIFKCETCGRLAALPSVGSAA
jgi:RNase P subunit RPR2